MKETGSQVGRVLVAMLMLFIGMLGLGMTACGLVASFAAVDQAAGMLIISIPSVLFGLGLIWLAQRKLRGGRRPGQEPPAAG